MAQQPHVKPHVVVCSVLPCYCRLDSAALFRAVLCVLHPLPMQASFIFRPELALLPARGKIAHTCRNGCFLAGCMRLVAAWVRPQRW